MKQFDPVFVGTLDTQLTEQQQNWGRTDELLSHLISLSEVICPEDEGVDDTEECDHVGDVVCGLQLIHDHTEAILLRLHTLEGEIRGSVTNAAAVKAPLDGIVRGYTIPTDNVRSCEAESRVTSLNKQTKKSEFVSTCQFTCLVVVQGIESQSISIRGEHAEGSKQLKHLLLHHGVGRVQGCGASRS